MKSLLPLLALLTGCHVTGTELSSYAKPGGVVVMGSSTALGAGASVHDSSWVGRLGSSIASNCPEVGLAVSGVYGYTTWHFVPASVSRASDRPASDAKVGIEQVLKAEPALVILQISSNDPSNGFPPSETLANHRLLLDSLWAHGILAIEVGPFPRYLAKGTASQMATLRDSLTRLVEPENRVDVWDSLALDSLHVKSTFASGDGVHLNDAGHAVIYRAVLSCPVWKAFCGGSR